MGVAVALLTGEFWVNQSIECAVHAKLAYFFGFGVFPGHRVVPYLRIEERKSPTGWTETVQLRCVIADSTEPKRINRVG